MDQRIPPGAVWALGVTQIVGYGTLQYSYSVLAPAIGAGLGWSYDWMFAALSVALLAGGLVAPFTGRLIDRVGAARTMTFGSIAAAVFLAAASASPSGWIFAASLVAMGAASAAVLYAAAFAALVQLGHAQATRAITHLTLIAGFASTLFWPLTAWLMTFLGWQQVYLVFAALNLLVCAPLHWWLARLTARAASGPTQASASPPAASAGVLPKDRHATASVLLLVGFAIEGFVLSAILMHIIPLLGAMGLAAVAVIVTTLFGPAQVLSRVTNMLLGKGLRQTHLGIIAATLPPLGVLVLVTTAPSPLGSIAFAILFGLGSGLTSIVSGSLPLELFGRERYGARLGWMSSARQIASAIAPFALALMMSAADVHIALWAVVLLGLISILAFSAVAAMRQGGVADTAQPQEAG